MNRLNALVPLIKAHKNRGEITEAKDELIGEFADLTGMAARWLPDQMQFAST